VPHRKRGCDSVTKGFREIWGFDNALDHLSARRQFQNWGWINQHLFREKAAHNLNQ
jgi:hypothetical protein